MKPRERKIFYPANRSRLTEEEMAVEMGIGIPALQNYKRQFGPCRSEGGNAVEDIKPSKLVQVAQKLGISEDDAITALKSLSKGEAPGQVRRVPIRRKSFKYGYFSDAHIGHEKFQPELFDYMVRFFKREKIDFILNPGDHLEGMSGRPGHVYELSHVGFDQQFRRAVELYSQLDEFPHYGIDGN